MLVLSRKTQQEIVIAGDIRITVVEIKGNRVKLGITASPEVAVCRQEVPSPAWKPPVPLKGSEAVKCVYPLDPGPSARFEL